ncbi:D-glutamate cyclase, mitochondrial-like [Stylophora pistillata]|nr:D-glutamate cyclase, mitochondrial-like [Stylophora pistillata]
MLSFKDRANWTGAQARSQFRQNFFPRAQTNGMSAGFTQASVHIIPSSAADQFYEFCKMNHAALPLVYRSKPGEVSAPPLAADLDIRTDQSAYGIYENGVCTKTVTDLVDIPFDDFVTFYVGCSSSFELAIQNAGLPVRQLESGRKAPVYQTRVLTVKSGPFSATVGMSLRPMPRNLVERAVQVTATMDKVHGAPVHIGHPSWIGVGDLQNPDFDDKPFIKEGDVCMFWACGVTAALALMNARLPLAISVSQSDIASNFITDLNNEEFNKMDVPKWLESMQTKAVFISEKPVFCSLISDKALELIRQLKTQRKPEVVTPTDEMPDALAKAALRLSHACSVTIVTLNETSTRVGLSVLSTIKSLLSSESKEVILLVPEEKQAEWRNFIDRCVELQLLKKSIAVNNIEARNGSSKDDLLQISRHVLSTMEASTLDDVLPRKFTALIGFNQEGGSVWVESTADQMTSNDVTKTSHSFWPGEVIAAALYILNCCPVHSRYLRKGSGLHQPLHQSKYLMAPKELGTVMSNLEVIFSADEVEDLINKINNSVSNAMSYLNGEA